MLVVRSKKRTNKKKKTRKISHMIVAWVESMVQIMINNLGVMDCYFTEFDFVRKFFL